MRRYVHSGPRTLCIGLADNELNVLLRILLAKKHGIITVSNAGIDSYAEKQLPVTSSVEEAAVDLGFLLYRHSPPHNSIVNDAKERGLVAIHHLPTHINDLKLGKFVRFFTLYSSVFDQWQERIPGLRLICDPDGVKPGTKTCEALPQIQSWIKKHC